MRTTSMIIPWFVADDAVPAPADKRGRGRSKGPTPKTTRRRSKSKSTPAKTPRRNKSGNAATPAYIRRVRREVGEEEGGKRRSRSRSRA